MLMMRLTLLFTLLAHVSSANAHDLDRIRSLPGLGELGDSHFSGYLSVQNLRVFYYYIPHPSQTAPLVAWMNGGPGSSSVMGMFLELGPYLLNNRSTNSDGTYTLLRNPYAWSLESSLLVWEQPAGVGYSRCLGKCEVWNDTSAAEANVAVLHAFYAKFPAERIRDLWISGESYAGVYIPMLSELIMSHNQARSTSEAEKIKLRGIVVGNGCVGYDALGGCGKDSLNLFVTTLEQGAPGVDREVLANARIACGAELSAGLLLTMPVPMAQP